MERFLERIAGKWEPHPGQREFLEHTARYKVLSCGRRWGKTDACAAQIAASFFRASPTRHMVVAPTQDQANLLFERAASMLRMVGKQPVVRKTPFLRLQLGAHHLTARSGHVAQSLRGNEATHIVVDEAAFVPESLVTDVLLPMLATTDGMMTLVSTPNGRNHFWRFFGMGQAGEHGVWSRTGPSEESPHVSRSFLAIQREFISERVYATEYEARFLDSELQFFRSDAIRECLVDSLREEEGQVSIGVDWGRLRDRTAAAVLRGTGARASLVECKTFPGRAWGSLVEGVVALVQRYEGALVTMDQTGLGDPMLESLRKALPRHAVKGHTFTSASKSAMAFGLQAMVEHRRLEMLPNVELIRELEYYEAQETETGFRFGAPQGMHDDLVSALMLAASALGHGAVVLPPARPRTELLDALAF